MAEPNRDSLEKYLMNLLARGAYTRLELERKLSRRSDDETMIVSLLDTFEDAGYIDDELYARLFVESHGDWSRRRLRDELQKRGIGCADARETVDALVDEEAEMERALEMAARWSDQGVEPRRIAGRLLRRGFGHSAVNRVLDELGTEDRQDLE